MHVTFQEQMDSFLKTYIETKPSMWHSFQDQCRKACADPFNVGKPLERVGRQALIGRIRRLWVGGRSGHRFIYIVHGSQKLIVPIFLSKEIRRDIYYDSLPWAEYADRIYDDLINGNTQAFHFMALLN